MAAMKHTYSISMDFPNHRVATDRLVTEIRASAIITAVDYINTSLDACDIWFKAELSTDDKTLLDGIVAAHSGEPLPSGVTPVILTSVDGKQTADMSANRMLVVNFPADFGSNLWLTSRGDDFDSGKRGRGAKMAIAFTDVVRTEPEERSVEIQFLEQVQLHDGHIDVKDPQNWGIDDEWDLGVVMAATTATPNPMNEGNCNLVDLGGYHAIVPAAGDGAYDADLATATPVPSTGGGWDYDYYSDTLSFPTDPGDTRWALLDVEVVGYAQIAVNIPFSPMGVFDFDAYDAWRVSPRWKLRLVVRKASNGPGTLAGWIVCFREQNT